MPSAARRGGGRAQGSVVGQGTHARAVVDAGRFVAALAGAQPKGGAGPA